MEWLGSDAQLWWPPSCITQTDSMESQVQGLQLESLQAAAGGVHKQQVQCLVLRCPGGQQTYAVGPADGDPQALKKGFLCQTCPSAARF